MVWHFEGGRLQKDAELIHRVALFRSKRCLVNPNVELGIL